ncbi:MAG: phosphoenolpyruvate carboxykinase, partial [Enterococcus cecorum]|nr:phosphoenolpyruvate carboxykinase [Enterococcus cecorum]
EFNGKKVTKEVTLGSIEKIIAESGEFKPFGTIEDVEYLAIDGYPVDFEDKAYCERLKDRMETRLDFIQAQDHLKDGYHALPQETAELMRKIVNQLS